MRPTAPFPGYLTILTSIWLLAEAEVNSTSSVKSAASKCPYLKENPILEAVTEASEGLRDDIIEIGNQSKNVEKAGKKPLYVRCK